LKTLGKTYIATAENIARYINGRFAPTGLTKEAFTLTELPLADAKSTALDAGDTLDRK
jgi:deoxyribodipyrimidine photo-lyase